MLYRVTYLKDLEVTDDVFTEDDYPTPERIEIFTNEAFADHLELSIIPEEFSSFVDSLENIRSILYFSYVDGDFSGDEVMFDSATYSNIYTTVWAGIDILVTNAQAISFNFDDLTLRANDTNKMILQQRPRLKPKPRPRDDDEYEPAADGDEEGDSAHDTDEPEAKRPKHEVE